MVSNIITGTGVFYRSFSLGRYLLGVKSKTSIANKNIIMQFRESIAIYLQIADYVCERILLKQWKSGERIPAVRELAVQLEVNPNTVMRTYEFLQGQNIIYNQRGIGYFVGDEAIQNATQYRKTEFIEKELPNIFRNMYMLGMDIEELKPQYEKFKQQNFD
jgi:DNA-binding transcriptional regulator YhcF (GntR family)